MSAVWAVIVSGLFTVAVAVYNQRSTRRARQQEQSRQARVDERAQLTDEWDRIRRALREEIDRIAAERDELEEENGQLRQQVASLKAELQAALTALENTYRLGIEHSGEHPGGTDE